MEPQPPRYLLYRVLEPLGPYIVGTWAVRGRSGQWTHENPLPRSAGADLEQARRPWSRKPAPAPLSLAEPSFSISGLGLRDLIQLGVSLSVFTGTEACCGTSRIHGSGWRARDLGLDTPEVDVEAVSAQVFL